MPGSEKPDHHRVVRARSGAILGWAMLFGGIAVLAVIVNLVTVQLPKLASAASAAAPGMTRNFLLWFATDKTIAQINALGTEWSGLLAVLGVILAVVFYLLSLGGGSGSKADRGPKP